MGGKIFLKGGVRAPWRQPLKTGAPLLYHYHNFYYFLQNEVLNWKYKFSRIS